MTEKKPAVSLAAALERARTVRPRLSTATDRLNQKLAEAEQSLTALQLGVPGHIVIDSDEVGEYFTNLVYRKTDKTWGLWIETGCESDQTWGEITPLLNASRESRLLAAAKLPALVQKLSELAEAEAKRVEDTVVGLEAFVDLLKGGQK